MLTYITAMLVVPIVALLTKASRIPLSVFIARASEPVAVSAYSVSFSMALTAAAVNAVFGFILAWVSWGAASCMQCYPAACLSLSRMCGLRSVAICASGPGWVAAAWDGMGLS